MSEAKNQRDSVASDQRIVIRRIADDPQIGDWVENRKAKEHPRRKVVDRYFSGDIQYIWDCRSDYHGRCTHDEWIKFCERAKVLDVGQVG